VLYFHVVHRFAPIVGLPFGAQPANLRLAGLRPFTRNQIILNRDINDLTLFGLAAAASSACAVDSSSAGSAANRRRPLAASKPARPQPVRDLLMVAPAGVAAVREQSAASWSAPTEMLAGRARCCAAPPTGSGRVNSILAASAPPLHGPRVFWKS
jgi:hypothetical protein